MARPKVSVLTTAYNPGHYLGIAIDSLQSQSLSDFEHVLIDNGCDDSSMDDLSPLNSRCNLMRYAENIGRTPALVKALEMATGEYVAILDADDVWHPSHLERLAAHLDSHSDVVVVGTWYRWIDELGIELSRAIYPIEPDDIRNRLSWKNPFANSATMFRRDAAISVGGYDEDFAYAQDFHLWLELSKVGNVAMIPEYLTDIRKLASSLSRSPIQELARVHDELRLYMRAGKELRISRAAHATNRIKTARLAIAYGRILIATGKPIDAAKWILWGLWRDPALLLRHTIQHLTDALHPALAEVDAGAT